MPPTDPLTTLLDLWVAALNSPDGRAERVARIFADAAVIRRYGVWDMAGQLAETLTGRDAIVAWLDRTPTHVTVTFTLAGDPEPATDHDDPDALSVPFTYGFEEFLNGGRWIVALNDEGQLRWLEHHPRELTEEQRAYSPPSEVVIANSPHVAHDHGSHEHDHGSHDHDHGADPD